jgi:lipopolysaccharide biosynthesis regulator YciM
MLAALLDTHPEFLRVYDELARMRLLQNRREEAVEILKRAAQKSGSNVDRMRQMAQLAEEMGDMTLAEDTFGRILERTRDTGMLSGEDYTNAARVLIAQGKVDQAEKVAADQARSMEGHPDQELSAAMLAFARTRRGDGATRQAAVRKLVEIEARDSASALSPRLVVQVISACLDSGMEDVAFQIAGRMAKRKGLDGTVMHEMQRLLDQHHQEVTSKQDKAAE